MPPFTRSWIILTPLRWKAYLLLLAYLSFRNHES